MLLCTGPESVAQRTGLTQDAVADIDLIVAASQARVEATSATPADIA
ncbi:hypothetical protein ACFQS1_38805 [Paractinoplanes rhizophilus]|uniref:Uncharacterized protein n=1 Tax=Paractinoplanes rhizophilus TaxID=1416877 RepID=A0ABW2I4Z9_9ACTN|nr:hypothetical protein [Actinoplanes sp.]